jgi:predicted transcriptional regulator of viral defense system
MTQSTKVEQIDAYVQRLGYLLEKTGQGELVSKLSDWIGSRRPRKIPLKPGLGTKGCPSDERWRVIVNIDVEGEL